MPKRVAVLVRERQGEALRVALGLTLDDNRVEVYVLDRGLEETPGSRAHLEALAELEIPVSTNVRDDAGFPFKSNAEIAGEILACDHVVVY